jgi:hypothetical protein
MMYYNECNHILNISVNTANKYPENRGYQLNIDFRNARLGNIIRGIYNPKFKENYNNAIACCSDGSHKWNSIATNAIPKGT